MNFNIAQLATWEDARDCAKKLSSGPVVVGGGVKPESADPYTTGIYIPDWLSGPAGFEAPYQEDTQTGKKYYYLHFRFRNGAEGMNVGLILDKFRRYPTSPGYVLSEFAKEADSLARSR